MDTTTAAVISAFQAWRDSMSEDAYLSLLASDPLLETLTDSLCDLEDEVDAED